MDVTQQASRSIASASDLRRSQVAETPEKANLRREVTQLRNHVVHTVLEVERFVKEAKVDSYEKARAILANQKTNFERTAGEYEQYARDVCRKRWLKGKLNFTAKLFQPFNIKMKC